MKKYIKKIFDSTNEYRAKPFWALNGKLDEKELKRQIAVMKEIGFGGAFLHSRTGLETEYMSDEWLRLIDACVDELTGFGMEAWLYDEDRWPSGTCGGLVAEKKYNRLKSMICEEMKPVDYKRPAHLIGLFAAKIKETTIYSYRRIYTPTQVKRGERLLVFRWAYMEPQAFFNGFTYIDTLNKSAVEDFLASTHEKYRQKMGDKFGGEIKGIFQDEVSRGPMLNGFLVDDEKKMLRVPYTYKLFETFRKIKKYDLVAYLPLLYYKNGDENFSSVTYDFTGVVMQMLLDNFIIPYHDWCKKNDLKVTGHVLHEDSLACQTTMLGSVMQYYEYMDYPGIDNLGTQNYRYEVPKLASSVSKQLGKKFTLSELYGCSGWQMKLNDYKHDGDWQAFMGINFRCPHLSWYTMKGEAKRDCPASIMSQSAWYKEYKIIEDYFGALNFLLSVGEDTTENLIINPIESSWGLSRLGAYINVFGVSDPVYQDLESKYAALFEGLQKRGIDADFGDEAIIAKHGKLENGLFVIGQKGYKRVIVSNLITIRTTTLALLKSFLEAGGEVYFVARYPSFVDGKKAPENTFDGFSLLPFDIQTIAERVREREYPVMLSPCDKGIFVRKRKTENGYVIAFLNSSKTERMKVKISIPTQKNIVKLNLRMRKEEYIPFSKTQDGAVIEYEFEEGEELIVCESDERIPAPVLFDEKAITVAEKVFRYTLSEDNYAVLDRAQLYIDGKWDKREFILLKDGLLRKKYRLEPRFGEMYQPWFKEKFQKEKYHKKHGKYTLRYTFDVSENIREDIYLMLEGRMRFAIRINGNLLDTEQCFASDIDICFEKILLPKEYISLGKNKIELAFDFSDDLNIEAIYLCGKFGVKSGDRDTLFNLPEKLPVGNIGGLGLPYYSGKLTYYLPLEKGEYRVEMNELQAAAVYIADELLAFRPYRSGYHRVDGELPITYVFNRKNLFGNNVGTVDGVKRDLQAQGMLTLPTIVKNCPFDVRSGVGAER